eukprot:jgi/Ulvmu1/7894/UM004_0126.1
MGASSGYQCLLLEIDGCTPHRHLYIKKHASAEADHEPDSPTLFVAGIPVKLAERLTDVFGAFGSVEQVKLHPRRTSAVVVFSKNEAVSKVLAAAKKGALVRFQINHDTPDKQSTGLRNHIDLHKAQYPGNEKLEQTLNSWMDAFEAAEEQRMRAAEAAAADDGWTVVTRKPGRKRKSGASVSGGISLAAAEEQASKKKSKLVSDFYRFQAREQKRNELVELQTQFAAAKKQVHALRASRKFQG